MYFLSSLSYILSYFCNLSCPLLWHLIVLTWNIIHVCWALGRSILALDADSEIFMKFLGHFWMQNQTKYCQWPTFYILQILAFYDMFHSLLFNFYIDIHTWKLILLELKLKYISSNKDNISIHYTKIHYLIHVLRVCFPFCCSILHILSLPIYCFKAPIILLQGLSQ